MQNTSDGCFCHEFITYLPHLLVTVIYVRLEKCKGGCTIRIGFSSILFLIYIIDLPQGCTTRIGFRSILFLIYIIDLPHGLHADIKLFANDTSLFSVADDIDYSASNLINHLTGYRNWLTNGKCLLILTKLSLLIKLYYPESLKMLFTLISILATCQLLKQYLKSTWDLTYMSGLHLTIT